MQNNEQKKNQSQNVRCDKCKKETEKPTDNQSENQNRKQNKQNESDGMH